MQEFIEIASPVCGVYLVMATGALARRWGWLTSQADRTLASLTGNILIPCLFFERILGSDQFSSLSQTWLPPVVGFGSTALGFLLAAIVVRQYAQPLGLIAVEQQRAFIACVGICNYGYIPLPLAEQLFPSAVVPLMVHNVGVDVALWSVGILVLSGQLRRSWWRVLGSPPLVAVVVAVGLKQLGLAPYVPSPVLQMSRSLGVCAIPMGLVLSGAIIIDHLRSVSGWQGLRALAAGIVLRQGLFPVLLLLFARSVLGGSELATVVMLQAAMPAATFPLVLVHLYHQDVATALRIVVGTSLMALVTIPIWIAVGRWWLGI
jgi:predicted permease